MFRGVLTFANVESITDYSVKVVNKVGENVATGVSQQVRLVSDGMLEGQVGNKNWTEVFFSLTRAGYLSFYVCI